MMKFNLDDNAYKAEFTYTVSGTEHKIIVDVVEADKFLGVLSAEFAATGHSPEGLQEFDRKWREYLERNGGQNIPDALLYQLIGYVPMALEEFKKKLPPAVQSHLSTESTPSTFEQLKDGRLKLASTPSEPSENLTPTEQPATLPPTG